MGFSEYRGESGFGAKATNSKGFLLPRGYFIEEFSAFEPLLKRHANGVVRFERGDMIKGPSVYLSQNFFLLKGICRVSVEHDTGFARTIGFWGRRSIYPLIVTESHFFLENMIQQVALTEVEALAISTEGMRKAMTENRDLAFAAIDHYARYTNMLKFSLSSQPYEDAVTRISNILYILYVNNNRNDLHPSQNELASMAGLRREAAVKALRILREEGVIQNQGRIIQVKDVEALLAHCSTLLR